MISLSHPSRMRGLKSFPHPQKIKRNVASLADAWIKIVLAAIGPVMLIVASLADAWIKMYNR